MTSAASSPASKDSISCVVHLADERTPHEITAKKTETGLDLLEKVIFEVGIVEKDYFGLSFKDHSGCYRWLEVQKTLAHQFNKLRAPVSLNLQIKFYPNDPLHLKNDFSRYLLYRQVRHDIYENRIYVPEASIPRLLGFLLQAEFLDWCAELPADYADQVKFRPESISAAIKDQAVAIHKTLAGMTVKEMEVQFVQETTNFPSYGLDMYTCKDQEDAVMVVGIGCNGISTFAFGKSTHSFKWREIAKMYYEGKQFFLTLRLRDHKHLCAFRCQSATQAKVMWKSAMERKTFFTAASSSENNRAEKRSALSLVLKRSTTFNFHGRVQREVIKDDIERDSPFLRYTWASNTLPRMGKSSQPNAQEQIDNLLMTPSPPSTHLSATTLEASPASETTVVENPPVSNAEVERPPGVLVQQQQPQSQTAAADSLYNTPPASPDLVVVTTTAAEDSGNLSATSDMEGTTFANNTTTKNNEENNSSSLRTYSTRDEDDDEDEENSIENSARCENEAVAVGKETLPPAISTTTANSAKTTCYHRSANPVPREAKSKNSPGGGGGLVLEIVIAFVLLLIFMVVLFELPVAQLKQLPFYANLRHAYYEPLRQAVVPRLQQFFNK